MQRRVGRDHAAGQHRPRRQGAQTDGPTPVLDDEGHTLEPQRLGELRRPGNVGPDRMGRRRHRLVRAAEPDQVGGHGPEPTLDQAGHDVPVQVGPGRLAVQQQDGPRGAGGSLVEVVQAQAVGQGHVAGFEGVSGQVAEPCIGRAEHLHGAQCAPTWPVCWTRCP